MQWRSPPTPTYLSPTYTTLTSNFLAERNLPVLSKFSHIAVVQEQHFKSQPEIQIVLLLHWLQATAFTLQSSFPCNLPFTEGPADILCYSEKYIFVFFVINLFTLITLFLYFFFYFLSRSWSTIYLGQSVNCRFSRHAGSYLSEGIALEILWLTQ
jgi:hypothetical protein